MRENEANVDKVIVAVENFLVEPYKNQCVEFLLLIFTDDLSVLVSRWFDVGLLLLSDPKHNIVLKSFTQMTFIPIQIIAALQSDTPADYDRKGTGFSTTIGAAMSRNLDVSFNCSANAQSFY